MSYAYKLYSKYFMKIRGLLKSSLIYKPCKETKSENNITNMSLLLVITWIIENWVPLCKIEGKCLKVIIAIWIKLIFMISWVCKVDIRVSLQKGICIVELVQIKNILNRLKFDSEMQVSQNLIFWLEFYPGHKCKIVSRREGFKQ